MAEAGRRGFRYAAAAVTAGTALDLLFATVHFRVSAPESYRRLRSEGRPIIFVLWHGRLLPLGYLHRGEGVVGIVSRSADGEYLSRILERWGFGTTRGSSSRGGGEALRELVRHARAGRSLAITPDGPRGPRERMKPGVLTAAQLSGVPIVPVSAGADRGWWVEGWDRFLVPKPFARVHVAYGDPVEVPRHADAEALDRTSTRLERELGRLTREVDGERG